MTIDPGHSRFITGFSNSIYSRQAAKAQIALLSIRL
jgi:hypothetical protein